MACTAASALEKLREGNHRFVTETSRHGDWSGLARRHDLVGGQDPFACILGCSDSRVPAEIVFDCALGDLFVIRVAGNVATPVEIGSVEFAIDVLNAHLIVVLGHASCGGVTAAVDHLQNPGNALSPNLNAIVERIQPAVEPIVRSRAAGDRAAMIEQAVVANVRLAAEDLRRGSAIIDRAVRSGAVRIAGGVYSLETGEVSFLD